MWKNPWKSAQPVWKHRLRTGPYSNSAGVSWLEAPRQRVSRQGLDYQGLGQTVEVAKLVDVRDCHSPWHWHSATIRFEFESPSARPRSRRAILD